MHGRIRLSLVIAMAATPMAACGQPPEGTARPAQPPAVATPIPGELKNADQLLDALETADKDLVRLVADVKWDRTFEIQGDQQIRLGHLYFVVSPPAKPGAVPDRRFAIHFDRMYVGGVKRPEDRTYVFDGQWLMEKDAIEKFFQKRQVVPPGETFDPLKIGQGPMTIPIGQKKADITARYTVDMVPPVEGLGAAKDASKEEQDEAAEAKASVEGCWQLKLTPKNAADQDEQFSEIRLWYRKSAGGDLLPRMARTVKKGTGDVSLVLLINTEAQYAGRPENPKAKVETSVLDTAPPPGWDGQTTPWRGHEAANGGER